MLFDEHYTRQSHPYAPKCSVYELNTIIFIVLSGYGYYIIVRQQEEDGNLRKLYVNDADGRPIEVYLADSARNPFRSIGNCYLKIVKQNGKDMIKGIIIEDDWVEANN